MKFNPALETPVRLGLFEIVSGKVEVSDPCYDLNVSCRASDIKTKNGTYVATVLERTYGKRDIRCTVLEATLEEEKGEWTKTDYDIGVDSGQAGIFDSKYYKDDEVGRKWKEAHPEKDEDICSEEPWYSMCCDLTCGNNHAGVVPHGAVSSSGWGDGGYELWLRIDEGLATGFRIVFIDSDSDSKDDEGWGVDEDEELEP